MINWILEKRATDSKDLGLYRRAALAEPIESILVVSDNYYLERRTSKNSNYLFYVHIENNNLKKICVYKRKEATK